MRILSLIALAGFSLLGCSTTRPDPVTYAEQVSVHSVMPVHVRMHEAYALPATADETGIAFDAAHQNHFVESLKKELIKHGIFGSIAETGGNDIFQINVNFARLASFPESNHYKLTVALATEYQGERDFNQYHVLFTDDAGSAAETTADSASTYTQAATELMSLMMGDIQKAIVDRKLTLRANVKLRQLDVPRMLVKW